MSVIRGAGGMGKGGGSSSSTPKESPDSLRSRQVARVLDLVCEGPVEGLVGGLQGIYLDGTPIQNADGTLNFSGVWAEQRGGYPQQPYIAGFPASEHEIAVAARVKADTPVVRSITDTNVNAVRVTVGIPQMFHQVQLTGDTIGEKAVIAIDVQNAGSGYAQVLVDTIAGKTMSRYQRSYRVELPAPGPWDIRVRRPWADSAMSNLQNQTWWDSYTEIIDARLSYPNSALVAVQVDASQFRAVPTRGYRQRGLIVRVPSNYDPIARTYSGGWDGTFALRWTRNPAWCFYDLVTSPRYGLGEYVDAAALDKWQLYTIGKYCDEIVPDGFGGWEPRFSCDLYLQTREEAYTVIQQFAAIFRAMVYWGAGAINCTQDSPADPTALITEANVVDGLFHYEGSSRRSRHTVALVAWNDPDNLYRQTVEYVEDIEGVARFGVIETQITALGCASRGQAHRMGKWLLLTEQAETETISFEVGLDHLLVSPGQVIQVQDAHRAGVRWGGRVVSATAETWGTAINIDAPVQIDAGSVYQLSCTLPDGTVATRTVANTPGVYTGIGVTPGIPYDNLPQAQAIWSIQCASLVPTLWRVISVAETDRGRARVTALYHHPDKYAAIERDLKLDPRPITRIRPWFQAAVTAVDITDSIYKAPDGGVYTRVTIFWPQAPGASAYRVEYRVGGGNWVPLPEVRELQADIAPALIGAWQARVSAVSPLGVVSLPKESAVVPVLGLTRPPPDVSSFLITEQPDGTRQFSWNLPNPPVDLAGFQIRHKAGDDAVWEDMQPAHTGLLVASPWETNQFAAGPRVFAIKAFDTSGVESVNALYIEATLKDPRLAGALDIFDELALGWPGTKTACSIKDSTGYLNPDETAPQPWAVEWDSSRWIIDPEDVISYQRDVDIGIKVAFTPLVTVEGDGTIVVQEQHSDDGSSWSAWADTGTMITSRYVRIKITATQVGGWPMLRQAVIILSAKPVSEDINDLNTGSLTGAYRIGVGDIRLPIREQYAIIRGITLALQGVGGNWSYKIIDKSASPGPRVQIYNGATLADATIDAYVRGL